jgi:hypothetical protein
VHCRAGIVRTHTVIGCWLRRESYSGPDAIERLNQLSQANAPARSLPQIPQTAEQQRYVLEWLEPAEPDQSGLDLDATRVLRDRYLGSMLGLACGDAMGASLQFRKPGQFAPLADLLGGGHWQLPRGAWTDDTAMALCLAESLLEMDGFDAADQVRRYRRWQHDGHLSSTGGMHRHYGNRRVRFAARRRRAPGDRRCGPPGADTDRDRCDVRSVHARPSARMGCGRSGCVSMAAPDRSRPWISCSRHCSGP